MLNKLLAIQAELKAPKGQYNSFGKYKYRSCEDILEAAKPVLAKHGCTLRISDSIELIGDRFYVKASAILSDGNKEVIVTAFAREEDNKKGMDGSQITGAASSYARKYALNGLFLIDDTKDADTEELDNQRKNKAKAEKAEESIEDELEQPATDIEKKSLMDYCKKLGYSTDDLFSFIGFTPGKDVMTRKIHGHCLQILMEMEKKKNAQTD